MTQLLTKYAAKKLLGKQMEKYKHKDVVNEEDPFFTYVPHPRKPGKMKKVKKQIPDYIPEHDAIILAKMRQRAYWLDNSLFNFAGVRFGWSSVIGLIPGFGDAIDGLMALLLVMRCSKVECGLGSYQMQMLFNVLIDFIVGLVPIIGDIADAAYRANTKNVRLLEKALDKAYKPDSMKKDDKEKRRSNLHVPPPATIYEDFSDDEETRLPQHRQDVNISYPEPTRASRDPRGSNRIDPKRKESRKSKGSRREHDPEARRNTEPTNDGTYYAEPPRDDLQNTRSARNNH